MMMDIKSTSDIQNSDAIYDDLLPKLATLQDKIKREPDVYKEEFQKILHVFTEKFTHFIELPNKNIKGIKDMFLFFAQVSHLFPNEIAFIPLKLITLLEFNYSIIHHEIRLGIVECLSLLRKKDLIDCLEVLPLFFKLLRCQDKILRRKLHEIIIADLSKINQLHKNNSVNKKLQNFCGEMLMDPNKKAARKTLNIMIILYKKKIWNDQKTVNAIAGSCTSNDSKIVFASAQFFLSEYEEDENDTSDEEDLENLKNKYKLLGKASNRKTKERKHKLQTLMKSIERREKRKSKVQISTDFMPIDQINDHTSFAEKLFAKLSSFKENFKLKLALMRLVGRIIGRHKIFINNFFNFMLSFLTPNQKELGLIFAALIEACHDLIPPSELQPIVDKLFDNFISETHPPQYITIGLNALRGMLERAPYVICKSEFEIIENLKEFKNKSVTNAARSIINLCKEMNSKLVDSNLGNEKKEDVYFGQSKAATTIDGIDLLKRHEHLPKDYKMEYDVILNDAQLRKIKVLKLKYNAENIQNKDLGITNEEINEMAGVEEEEEDEDEMEEIEDDEEEGEVEDEEFEEIEGEEDEDEEDEDEVLSLNESKENEDEQSLDVNSSELKSNSDEEEDENPHGFIDPNFDLLTYKKRFREKKDDLKNEEKEKYVYNRKKKNGGLTNKEKNKFKPLMMMMPKKRKEAKEKLVSMNKKIKNLKQQLGRFKRGNMVLKKKGGITRKKMKK